MIDSKKPTLSFLAEIIDAELIGDGNYTVEGLNTLQNANSKELAFLANPTYQKYLATTQAGAVLLNADQSQHYAGSKLILTNPYLGYAKLTAYFDRAPVAKVGVHPSAVVDNSATLGAEVSIGPNAVVSAGTVIEDGVIIGAGSCVGEDSHIGANSHLHANVTITHGVYIGRNCIFHSGSVIGADGFGFAPDNNRWQKIHQLGGVVIGDRVEVGAGTTIDRGALGDTRIDTGVIIDNLVMIAHNVHVGEHTAIAGCSGIAGSTSVGKNCTIAGGVGMVGHINVCDGVHVSGMTLVNKSIKKPGAYSSGTGITAMKKWRKNAVRFSQLDDMAVRLKTLERKIKRSLPEDEL